MTVVERGRGVVVVAEAVLVVSRERMRGKSGLVCHWCAVGGFVG